MLSVHLRRVEVIGGGPAGLFAARLIKGRQPECAVRVSERTVPDETFGFGVALTARTLRAVADAEPSTHEELRAASVPMPAQEFRINDRSARSRGVGDGIAIARSALLEILLRKAREAGVEVDLGSERSLAEVGDADLVVAADGVGSSVRASLNGLGTGGVTYGRGVFIWLGLDARLESNLFAPAFTEHGMFNIHGYPYSADRSTIGVETDTTTFRAAAMDKSTEATPLDGSDTYTIDYLQRAFDEILQGAKLLGNRSRWMHFPLVSIPRWHEGNVVLIGDAAHTAHYSVGSGTKLALEDAIALAEAVAGGASLDEALAQFERVRRPRVEALQDRALRSQWWWESFRERVGEFAPAQLMLAYLSRAGAVSAVRLAQSDPALVREGLAAFADCDPSDVDTADATAWVLARPLRRDGVDAPHRVILKGDARVGNRASCLVAGELGAVERARKREPNAVVFATTDARITDPWGEEASELVQRCAALSAAGADGICLTGPPGRRSLLDRLALAERIRLQVRCFTVVGGPRELVDDLADGVIAGRVDLVALEG